MLGPQKLALVAAVGLFLMTVLAAIFVAREYLFSSDSQETVSAPTAPPTPGQPQIQVGILLSQFTATGPHRQVNPYGYQTQLRPLATLRDPQIHLVPVIEPGTARTSPLRQILSDSFPGERPLDVTNTD